MWLQAGRGFLAHNRPRKQLVNACGGKGVGRKPSRDDSVPLPSVPGGPGASSPRWTTRRWDGITTVNFESWQI